MCQGFADATAYEARFGDNFADRYSIALSRLAPMERDGLLERRPDGSVRLTPLGRFLVRNVAMEFDAYLPEQQKGTGSFFSATV